jgi:hypothetical protein
MRMGEQVSTGPIRRHVLRAVATFAVAYEAIACGATEAPPEGTGASSGEYVDAGTSGDSGGADGSLGAGPGSNEGSDGGSGGRPIPDADSGGGIDVRDGGTTSSDCDGLMGALAPAKIHTTSYSTMNGGYCGLPIGDSEGYIAVEVSESDHPRWQLLSPAGTRLGSVNAWRGALFPASLGYFIEQGNSGGANNSPDIQGVDRSGRLRDHTQVYGMPIIIPAPHGELLLLGPISRSWISPPERYRQSVWMLRDDGSSLWGPNPLAVDSTVFGGGTDSEGRTLVFQDGSAVYGSGSIAAQWFDLDGTPLTAAFQLISGFIGASSTWFETSPIFGGGLAVRRMDLDMASGLTTSEWLVMVSSGSSRPDHAPEWLRARQNRSMVQVLRAGGGYAMLPWGADMSPCAQSVEILSLSGASCGTLTLPSDAGSCRTRDLRVGLDGTLLQMLPLDREQSTIPGRPDVHTCTLLFWPAALR